MFDLSLFISIILVLLLWVVMRLNRKIDMIGQLSTVMLTHLAVTSIVIPDEEVEKAVNWETWDKS
jgi:integral membrane sensor domain MASE1